MDNKLLTEITLDCYYNRVKKIFKRRRRRLYQTTIEGS